MKGYLVSPVIIKGYDTELAQRVVEDSRLECASSLGSTCIMELNEDLGHSGSARATLSCPCTQSPAGERRIGNAINRVVAAHTPVPAPEAKLIANP